MKDVTAGSPADRTVTLAEQLAAQIVGDEARASELFRGLPDHVPRERFQRNLINLLMQQPEMMKYEPRLIYREVSKAAALGLLLDPQLGEAFILPLWNGKAKREEPVLRAGYRGLIKLARQSGEVAAIYAHEVHEKDHIDCDLGVDKRLVHKPDLFGERGEVIGYYAVVKYRDGMSDFEPMSLGQVHMMRERSDAWIAFKAGKIASTPWASDEVEMGKKTVIRRLLKRVPQSPDLAMALRLDDEAPAGEDTNVIDIRRLKRRASPRSIAARLDQFAGAGEGTPEDGAAMPAERIEAVAVSAPARPASVLPRAVVKAMERGRKARHDRRARKLPKGLTAKKRSAEAEAFLRGWDEEAFEMRAEEFGCV